VARARLATDESMGGGQEVSALARGLKELAWIYVEAGGSVTGGSNSSASFFARWAFEIFQALPEELVPTLPFINNLVRNMNWSDLRRPYYLV
jgi:hypothetical protein